MIFALVFILLATTAPGGYTMTPATPRALAATSGSARMESVKRDLLKAKTPRDYVEKIFSDKRLKIYPPSVVPRVAEPRKYSANILAIESIARGRDFLFKYRDALEEAEENYGVPKEHIVAVLRVESNLGSYLGALTVMNVFYTRLVTSPDGRWQSDAVNLAALVRYCYITKADCYSIKGSNAGAFGLAQVLPYSALEWGVDGNGDGVVNLFDVGDSIPSAANFLQSHGWGETAEDKSQALTRYYGAGKSYPAAVLGYADALRRAALPEQKETSPAPGKVSQLIVLLVTKTYCLFSSLPYCED